MRKLFKSVFLVLALSLGVSGVFTAFADGPEGYEDYGTAEYTGSVIGYDTTTSGNWLADDNKYLSGDMDATRMYGTSAYYLPMAKLATSLLNTNQSHLVGYNNTHQETWADPVEKGFSVDTGNVVSSFEIGGYSTAFYLSGDISNTTTSNVLQIPQLSSGSLDQYVRKDNYWSADYGTLVQFDMADDDKEYVFTTYFTGSLEDYRVCLYNGNLRETLPIIVTQDKSYNGVKYSYIREDYLLRFTSNAVSGAANSYAEAIPDEYIDVTDFQAENGVYVSFRIKGDFAVLIGCKTDYTRQTLYGYNANVRGFFFDEISTSATPSISDIYSKTNQRVINFSWTNTDTTSKTVILRKLDGENNPWVPIAVLGKGIGTYTDNSVDSASTYQYAFGVCKDGQYKDFVLLDHSFTTNADYTDNTLTLTPSTGATVNIGETVRISASLKDALGNGIAGENIYLTLNDNDRYIGTFISDTTYTAITNSKGNATFDIVMNYSNYEDLTGFWSYQVTVKTEYNDIQKYNPVTATTSVTVKAIDTQAGEAPTITELSDVIKPGDILNITGANFYEVQGLTVYLTPAVEEAVFNDESAISLEIIQYDVDGAFINAQVPEDLDAGLYDVWVVTNAGVMSEANGNTTRVNAPRIYWISQDNIFEGLHLQIVGINFMPTAYGVANNNGVAVRFINNKGVEYLQPIVDLNSYMVEVICNDLPVGEYDVQVTTDGGITWSNVPNEQTLNVVLKSVDPLGLGVAWVNRYNWTNVVDVTDYGAVADDGEDDTLAIWRAIDAIKAMGGGIVYIPEGTYEANNIPLANKVVVIGAGNTKTKILYNGVGGDYLFFSGTNCTGECGVANMLWAPKNNALLPDQWFQAGDQWGVNGNTTNQNSRVSECIFVKAVDIDAPVSVATPVYIKRDGTTADYRGIAIVAIMDKYFLVEDCTWVGSRATVYRAYINGYMTMRNNVFVFSAGCLVATSSYAIGTGNTLIGHHEYYDGTSRSYDQHGFFHRDRIYIADNYIKDTGTAYNDGESICAEPINASYAYGRVLGTGIDTENYTNTSGTYEGRRWIEIGNDNAIRDISYGVFSRLMIAITGGTGVGQVKYLDPSIPLSDSANNNVVYLAEYESDWTIAPDATSTYSLLHSVENVVIYNNRVYDSTKGVLCYGQFHDSVVANNYMEETEGISIWGAEVVSTNRFNLNYRFLVKDNICIGTGKTGVVSIGCTMNYNQGVSYNSNVQSFHIEIRDNYIYGDDDYTQYTYGYYDDMQNGSNMRQRRANASSETHCMDGLVLYVTAQATNNFIDILPQKMYNVLFNNNTVENTYNGIYIGNMQIKGVLVNNSTFIKVRVPHGYADGFSNSSKTAWQATLTNIIIDRNEQVYDSRSVFLADTTWVDMMKPIWGESTITMLKVGSKAMAIWGEAHDNIGVDHYVVYVNGSVYNDNCTTTSIAISGTVNSVAVYAVDKAGNVSDVPLVAGNKVTMAGATSIGAVTKGVNNDISYYAQLTAYDDISSIKFKVTYDKVKLSYVDSELLVDGSYTVDSSKTGVLVYDITLNGDYAGDYTSIIKANFTVKNGNSLVAGTSHVDFTMSNVEIKNNATKFDYVLVNDGFTSLEVMDKSVMLDFNGDGKLSLADYNKVVSAFGSTEDDESWLNAAEYDINGDGKIDIEDLMLVYYNLKN